MIAKSVGSVLVPDGIYEGNMNGFRVRFKRGNQEFEFETSSRTKEKTKVKIVVTMMKANIYKV